MPVVEGREWEQELFSSRSIEKPQEKLQHLSIQLLYSQLSVEIQGPLMELESRDKQPIILRMSKASKNHHRDQNQNFLASPLIIHMFQELQ